MDARNEYYPVLKKQILKMLDTAFPDDPQAEEKIVEIREMLEKFPDDASWDDIKHRLRKSAKAG